jgi:hypothetical protein
VKASLSLVRVRARDRRIVKAPLSFIVGCRGADRRHPGTAAAFSRETGQLGQPIRGAAGDGQLSQPIRGVGGDGGAS